MCINSIQFNSILLYSILLPYLERLLCASHSGTKKNILLMSLLYGMKN